MKGKLFPASLELLRPLLLLSGIVLASVAAPWLAPYDPNQIHMAARLQGPSATHWLGTDTLGRDLFSRVLYGGRLSLVLALAATFLSMLLGLVLGALAGYFSGWPDHLITTLTNIFQGLPGTSFMVAIAGIMGPGFHSLLLGLVITSWAGFARIVRAEVMHLKEEPFIEGIRCLGASDAHLLFRHILPHLLGNTVVLFTTRAGRTVQAIASLSFLGLGLQPPAPDWSVMISDARMYYRSSPHLILVPGTCILLLLLSINLLGDALRNLADRRSQEVWKE